MATAPSPDCSNVHQESDTCPTCILATLAQHHLEQAVASYQMAPSHTLLPAATGFSQILSHLRVFLLSPSYSPCVLQSKTYSAQVTHKVPHTSELSPALCTYSVPAITSLCSNLSSIQPPEGLCSLHTSLYTHAHTSAHLTEHTSLMHTCTHIYAHAHTDIHVAPFPKVLKAYKNTYLLWRTLTTLSLLLLPLTSPHLDTVFYVILTMTRHMRCLLLSVSTIIETLVLEGRTSFCSLL